MSDSTDWLPDVLGDGFQQRTLALGEDREGEVVATIVRHLPSVPLAWLVGSHRPLIGVDVLYVHGWSDYFFQRRLARFWADRGARFYALDLRKYGRSLRSWQTPGFITDLATYDEDISAALEAMGRSASGAESDRRLVLMGHSTGGLILSLWADRHPDAAAALVLNSPWLEFQLSGMTRAAVAPIVEFRARTRPLNSAPQVDLGFYARAQEAVADPSDPMDINPQWRPSQTMAVHAGWLNAILVGHAHVATGLDIPVPVCVLLSAKSAIPTRWSEELTAADSVLVVDDIARAALKLGPSVTVERIDGALHDVFLSRHEARDLAYERLDRWAMGYVGTWHPA